MRKFILLAVVAVTILLIFFLCKQRIPIEKPVIEKMRKLPLHKKPVAPKPDKKTGDEPPKSKEEKKEPKRKKVEKEEEKFKGVVLILEGEVVEEGSPVGFAQVYVMGDTISSRILCDSDGRFSLSFLLAEEQRRKGVELLLTAVRWWSGFNYAQKRVVVSSEQLMNPSSERIVKVSIELILNATGELSGRVITVDGSPLEKVIIRIKPTDERNRAFWRPGFLTGTKTDKDGNYTIRNLASGKYSVSASLRGYLCKEEESGKIFDIEVKIEAGKATRCDFRAYPFNRIKISVVSEEGKPISGAYCDITIGGRGTSARTNDEGVCYGYYSDAERNSSLQIKCMAVGYESSVYKALVLPESAQILLRKGGEVLEGIVCDEQGNPVSDVLLLLWDNVYRMECGRSKSGRDGKFCFSGLVKEHKYSILFPSLLGYEVRGSKLEGLMPNNRVRIVLAQVKGGTAEEALALQIMRELGAVLDTSAVDLLGQNTAELKLWAERITEFLKSRFDKEVEDFLIQNGEEMNAEELKRFGLFVEYLKELLTNTAEFLRQLYLQ